MCDKMLRNKLQILQNRVARVIIGARYDYRIKSSDLLQSLGWDTIHIRWAKVECLSHDMDLPLPKPRTYM